MHQVILKRDGTTVSFDASKIATAIAKAGAATGEIGERAASELAERVVNSMSGQCGPTPTVVARRKLTI